MQLHGARWALGCSGSAHDSGASSLLLSNRVFLRSVTPCPGMSLLPPDPLSLLGFMPLDHVGLCDRPSREPLNCSVPQRGALEMQTRSLFTPLRSLFHFVRVRLRVFTQTPGPNSQNCSLQAVAASLLGILGGGGAGSV